MEKDTTEDKVENKADDEAKEKVAGITKKVKNYLKDKARQVRDKAAPVAVKAAAVVTLATTGGAIEANAQRGNGGFTPEQLAQMQAQNPGIGFVPIQNANGGSMNSGGTANFQQERMRINNQNARPQTQVASPVQRLANNLIQRGYIVDAELSCGLRQNRIYNGNTVMEAMACAAYNPAFPDNIYFFDVNGNNNGTYITRQQCMEFQIRAGDPTLGNSHPYVGGMPRQSSPYVNLLAQAGVPVVDYGHGGMVAGNTGMPAEGGFHIGSDGVGGHVSTPIGAVGGRVDASGAEIRIGGNNGNSGGGLRVRVSRNGKFSIDGGGYRY